MTITTEQGEKIVNEQKADEQTLVGFVNEINEGWKKNVEHILELSTRIAEIKKILTKDNTKKDWTTFCKRKDLNIKKRTIDRLVTIGNWELKDDPAILHKLPASWGTIYEIVVWNTSDNSDYKERWRRFIKPRTKDTPEKEIRLNADITRAEVARAKEGKTKDEDTYKTMIEIEIDKATYKNGDAWDIKKLQKIKEKLQDIEKITASLSGIKVNTTTLNDAIKTTEEGTKKAEDNKKRDERKIKQKLANMVDELVSKSQTYKDYSTSEIEDTFHSPGSIEGYVKALKSDLGKNKIEDYSKCFMGTYNKAYFEKLLK